MPAKKFKGPKCQLTVHHSEPSWDKGTQRTKLSRVVFWFWKPQTHHRNPNMNSEVSFEWNKSKRTCPSVQTFQISSQNCLNVEFWSPKNLTYRINTSNNVVVNQILLVEEDECFRKLAPNGRDFREDVMRSYRTVQLGSKVNNVQNFCRRDSDLMLCFAKRISIAVRDKWIGCNDFRQLRFFFWE